MKKVLTLLVVLGILLMGTFAIAGELSESLDEKSDISEGEDFGDSGLGPTPCGGGDGGGQGGIPG